MATILVVDDNSVDLRLAGGFVEQEGSLPIYAESGEQALKLFETQSPDVVLTDLQMPGMNGLELVQHIKRDHPSTPVILMTAYGSEDIAAEALHAGAASYVPKKNLKSDLSSALRIVLSSVRAAQDRARVREFLQLSESYFKIGYEPSASRALIGYFQDSLDQLRFCGQMRLMQISTALTEAISNSLEHGNLELDSKLREAPDNAYQKLGNERSNKTPYCDRRVHIRMRLTSEEATFVIQDEGPGFDPESLPDPTDPENLLKPSGRGVMLIRTFMDEVRFNDRGNEITMISRRREESDESE